MTFSTKPVRKPGWPPARVLRPVFYIIGAVQIGMAGLMLTSALVSVIYREWDQLPGLLSAVLVTALFGFVLFRFVGHSGPITVKVGFAAVGLSWFVISLFGSLPFIFTGAIVDFTNAYFETASGFSTTGASIIPDPAVLSRTMIYWRALTQWIGGMGVIVLSVAILPLLGTGGVQLAKAESPGGTPDRLTPRFQDTARRLWLLYGAFTLVQTGFLVFSDMDLFEALTHSFTTMSTGGFSNEATSLDAFSSYAQWVVTVFMLLAGASFTLHLRALRNPIEYWRSAELKLYLGIVFAAIVIMTGGLLRDQPLDSAIREAAFNSISLITTTGYSTADFGVWRPALQVLVFGLLFIGGMSGSTAGAVKVFRVGILSKAAVLDVRRIIHPRAVFSLRYGKERVPDHVVESIQSFFLFYMFIFMTSTFLVTFIDANLTERLDLVTAASAVATAMGNVGPGLGDVGPLSNFQGLPGLVKWLLSGLMIVGRLEVFPVLVLFSRDLWKR